MGTTSTPSSLEAKIVVLGSQGVGKTSLVHRYVKNTWIPPNKAQSTVGASFLTTRVNDPESGATIRLQMWDTAGQERFRSISRLYYRGANAAILCYDVTSKKSFDEMGTWLKELRENCGIEAEEDMILHVVGTKSDVVAEEPTKREVPFERCIGYVAEQLYPGATTAGAQQQQSPTMSQGVGSPPSRQGLQAPATILNSPNSNRSSGFWGQEHIWDCCHEISARDGEGIEEVFRVITRKLVEQHAKRAERQRMLEEMSQGRTPGTDGGATPGAYFDLPHAGTGSFRIGAGDKRKSWLGSLATPGGLTNYGDDNVEDEVNKGMRKGRCC